ncbi:hypothetical protein C5Y44_08925 [Corynebacterium sp. J010B-136]|nr:hypothetical protein C5Y44_08925 [Corynebacterium sp. J010B-136]
MFWAHAAVVAGQVFNPGVDSAFKAVCGAGEIIASGGIAIAVVVHCGQECKQVLFFVQLD